MADTRIKSVQPQHLLQSKLTPPVSGRILVTRTRLVEWLRSAKHAKMAIIQAPAGFGKTTLMVQWLIQLREQGIHTAWLTLDEGDNDVVHFLMYLIAAIEKGIPESDRAKSNLGQTGPVLNPTGALLYLIDLISAFEAPFTIFLDDFGVIRSPEALELIQQLLLHLPYGKQVIIAHRHVPELNLGRLRAQGDLVEIDLEGLRFSLEETSEFIRGTQGLDLDEKEIENLFHLTEGWIAGLQLSTLSSIWRENKGNNARTFPAVFDNISSYLAEDVLAGQPDNIQSFLVQTSILERLSGPLCDALTGQSDGCKMLQYLEKQNLFLVPLDDERSWYRYHSLFTMFLQRQLIKRGQQHLVDLHRAACDWHARSGEPLEAAKHAMLAGDAEHAADLLETCVSNLTRSGLFTTIAEWAERIPENVLGRHSELMLCYTYALIFSERYEKAHEILDRLADSIRLSQDKSFCQDLRIARAYTLVTQENFKKFEQVTLEALSEYNRLKPDTQTRFLPVLMSIAGMLKLTVGKLDEALSIIWEGARLLGAEKNEVTVYNKYFEGQVYLAQGKLYEALLSTHSIIDDPAYGTCRYSAGGTNIAVLEAEILYEKNDLVNAEKLLTTYRSMLPTVITVEAMITGFLTLARICRANGDLNGAMRYLTELERLGIQRGLPRASATARQERVRMTLQCGELIHALQFSVDDDQAIWIPFEGYCMLGNDPETPKITRLRLLSKQGKSKEALESLKSELIAAKTSGHFRQVLLLRILIAKTYELCGERRHAIEFLNEALVSAQYEGFIRCFVDEGDPIPKLIREIHRIAVAEESMGHCSISINYLVKILHAMGLDSPRSVVMKSRTDASLLESLTDREKIILEKLATGFSSEKLADNLCISVNTVKYHLKNIYSKLGANNRVEAIALARSFDIIK